MFTKAFAFLLAATLPVLAGCATTLPPRELQDARLAFSLASNGSAAQHNPADLEIARQALSRAEQAFAEAPDAESTKDYAYLAEVKSLTAEARGRLTASEKARASADAQFKVTAGNKLDAKNVALANETARSQATGQALVAEQQRRSDAEKRLRDTMDRLAALAAIKEEPRGTVITLSGSVLFATDKSDLLPSAAERLNEVADALNAQPERSVTILGFTDSTGDAAHNQGLSERRAQSVRDYLLSRNVAKDRLSAVGKGPSDPVADNGSAEGRANNRRVEIVVARPANAVSSDVYHQ
jgi:outer membrane protein OmpA-like peptidoglycan-associated protein